MHYRSVSNQDYYEAEVDFDDNRFARVVRNVGPEAEGLPFNFKSLTRVYWDPKRKRAPEVKERNVD